MTNVTNEVYPVNTTGGYSTQGFDGVLLGQPRMYGFRLRVKFGA